MVKYTHYKLRKTNEAIFLSFKSSTSVMQVHFTLGMEFNLMKDPLS